MALLHPPTNSPVTNPNGVLLNIYKHRDATASLIIAVTIFYYYYYFALFM